MRKDEDLRRAVLEASLLLIEKQGLDNLSMREVARTASVSHQAPYHHFGDRAGIFAVLATEGFEILKAEMTAAIAAAQTNNEKFLAGGVAYVNFALSRLGYFKVMFRRELIPFDQYPEVRKSSDRVFKVLVSIAKPMVKKGDPKIFALSAWAQSHGIATLAIDGALDPSSRGFGKKRRELCEAMLRAYVALVE